MSVAYMARSQSMKLMNMGLCIFRRGFNSSKCKTWAKMATARIKLLRNKRQVVVKQMRRDVALLLESGQDATARVRVEHVIREQNMMAANEIIELFCEHLVAKLSIISKQRDCPTDLKESICSLIFAGPRCSDIPELLSIRDIFQKKYGKDFVSAAVDLRPESGVNRQLIEKLSAKHPSGQVKLKVMKEIAKEYQIDWDATETEEEFINPLQNRIQGPSTFVSASNLPVVEPTVVTTQDPVVPRSATTRSSQDRTEQGGGDLHFQDAASAAEAAARSAKDAIAAAEAAAKLANKGSTAPHAHFTPPTDNFIGANATSTRDGHGQQPSQRRESQSSSTRSSTGGCRRDEERDTYNNNNNVRPLRRESFGRFDDEGHADERDSYDNVRPPQRECFGRFDDEGHANKRDSYNNVRPPPQRESFGRFDVLGGGKDTDDDDEGRVDIKFDESDCDEEIEMEPKPFSNNSSDYRRSSRTQEDLASRRTSHPKLPDYDTLAARFDSLRNQRSQYR